MKFIMFYFRQQAALVNVTKVRFLWNILDFTFRKVGNVQYVRIIPNIAHLFQSPRIIFDL